MTLPADTAAMTTDDRTGPHATPLASYVLRVKGRPATLVYELLDVRTGERRRFSRAAALVAFLAQQGLAEGGPLPPSSGQDGT